MSDKQKLQDEFLTCSICLEIFQEPKTLSCLHRFCEQCLQEHIENETESNHKGFRCPVCRQLILSPNPKAPPSQWASLLKTDFHLKELIKFYSVSPGPTTAKTSTLPRHPCDEHPDSERDLYCTDCGTAVCHLCSGISHRGCGKVMTIKEAAADRRVATEVLITNVLESCSRSSSLKELQQRAMDQFCKRKAAVGQAIRKRVNYLENVLQREERRLLQSLDHEFNHENSRIATRCKQFDEKIEQLINSIDNYVSTVGAASDFDILTDPSMVGTINVNQDVILAYENFVSTLSHVDISFEASTISSFSVGEVEITVYHEASENSSADMKPSFNDGSENCPCATHVESCEAPRNISSMTDFNTQYSTKSRPVSNSDASEHEVKSLSRTRSSTGRDVADMRNTPTTSATALRAKDESHVACATPESQGSSASASNKSSTCASSASLVYQLKIDDTLFPDDFTIPKLRGVIVTFPDHVIVATDWANEKIKAFRLDKGIRDELLLPGKPWAVTQLKENVIAVTLPLLKKIGLYKTTPKLEAITTFTTSIKYTGLAALDRHVLVACGASFPIHLDFIDLKGKVLKKFVTFSCGFPEFVYPAFVCVTPSAKIVVSDRDLGFVLGVNLDGVQAFRFSSYGSQKLQVPNGVACDPSGRIVVADSRGLTLYSPEGRFEKILVAPQDELVTQPWGVTVDDSGLIYVTSNDHELVVLADR